MSACEGNDTKVVKELLGSKPDLSLTNEQVHHAHSCALHKKATLLAYCQYCLVIPRRM